MACASYSAFIFILLHPFFDLTIYLDIALSLGSLARWHLIGFNQQEALQEKKSKTHLSDTNFCFSSLPPNPCDSGCVPLHVSITSGQHIFHSYSCHWVLLLSIPTLIPSDIGAIKSFHCCGLLNASPSLFAISSFCLHLHNYFFF